MIKNIVEHAVIPSNLVGTAIEYKDKLFMFACVFGYDPNYLIKTRDNLITFSNKHLSYLRGIERNIDVTKTVAESAKTAAESAKTVAESAKTAAESAKTAAESAKNIVAELSIKNGDGDGSIVLVVESDTDEERSKATGRCSVAFARYATASGEYAMAFGYDSKALGRNSISFGQECETAETANGAVVFGFRTKASGEQAIATGWYGEASGQRSRTDGERCNASGINSRASGRNCTASGKQAVADGEHCKATGADSHAINAYTKAIGSGSFAYGFESKALGKYAVAGGYNSESGTEGDYSYTFAHGYEVKAPHTNTAAFGRYNNPISERLFMVGKGSNDTNRSNAFSVKSNGDCIAAKSFINNSADYAEYFEWEDGNPENEDRVGYFVTLTENGKIRKANEHDDILGVVSATPSVIGNAFEDEWQGKYLTDEWGRIRYQTVTYPAEYNEAGEQVSDERVVEEPILSPEYDPTKEYIPRSKRKEWAPIGLLGQLLVRDSGDSKVGDYLTARAGIGVKSGTRTNIRVIAKVSDDIVKVLIK